MKSIVTKPNIYLSSIFFITVSYILVMRYSTPEWLQTNMINRVVDSVASIIPSVAQAAEAETDGYFWEAFSAIFWCLTPIFFALGFLYTSTFSSEYYERSRTIPVSKFLLAVIFSFGYLALMVRFSFSGLLFDLSSQHLFILITSWCAVAFAPWFVGFILGSCYFRFFRASQLKG